VDVCVLGRIGYDLYAVEHNRPLPEVEHFGRRLGGSSANIAVGLARLGLRVGIISCVGKDLLADYLLGFLANEHVDTQHVRLVEGYNTSLCLTEVSPPDHFPQVFYRREPADSQVVLGPSEEAYIRQARMFLTNGTSLSASPAREATVRALKTAHGAGLRTVLDIDYRASSWLSPEEAGRAARAVLLCVDILIGNEDEVFLLTGERERRLQVEAVLASGTQMVVCKLGAKGVEAHTRQQSCLVEPIPIKVVSTIGAGDGFAAGFLYALDRNLPLEQCLSYGNVSAAIVVSRVSCSDAMPYLRELTELLGTTSYTAPARDS
jgi:5-dehydro-2-deoxygluconokinase